MTKFLCGLLLLSCMACTNFNLNEGSDGASSSNRFSLTAEEEAFNAIRVGDLELLDSLLARGVDINQLNDGGNTLLHEAIEWDQLEIVHFLLEERANATLRNLQNLTPLDLAERKNSLLVLHLLNGTDPSSEEVSQSFFMAVSQRKVGIVRYCIKELNFDVDQENETGKTALILSVSDQSLETVSLLLTLNANPNFQIRRGQLTSLMICAQVGNSDIARLLLSSGAVKGLKNLRGQTAYEIAIDNGFDDLGALLK
ncbi:hypothetical protein GW915_01415 [bacterium]|nr:hypothetical protein [bacterium]